MHNIIFIFAFLVTAPVYEKEAVQVYVQSYGAMAVAEMHRTGIPASVKLAQAIIESKYGTSKFARQTNNHFGIKCKTYWKGKTYYHKDDDYDASGVLMESCFRAYEHVFDSYVDHSNFLKESITYEPLFRINNKDYKSWAHGLQQEGYASDRNYSRKLIRIIESYELFHWDRL